MMARSQCRVSFYECVESTRKISLVGSVERDLPLRFVSRGTVIVKLKVFEICLGVNHYDSNDNN